MNLEAPAPEPARRGRSAAGMVVAFLAAIVSAGWPADLPFRLDDYVLLPRTGMLLRTEPWTERAEEDSWRAGGVSVEGRAADQIRPFFRPTSWLLWRMVGSGADQPWRPGPFRGLAIAAHGIAVLLFFFVLRSACGFLPGPATFGALLFAVHPGGRQAYTWISALPDVLMTVFALGVVSAVVLAKSRPGRTPLAAAAVLAMCGGLSKEGFPFLLPGIACLYWTAPAKATFGRTFQAVVSVLLGYAAAIVVRRGMLGTWSFAHFVDVSPDRATGEAFAAALMQAVVPISLSPSFATGALRGPEAVRIWRGTFVAACGLLWLVAAWRGPRAFFGAAASLLAAAVSAAVLLLPAAVLSADWPPEARATAGLSRSFYPVVAVVAVLIAGGAAAAGRSGSPALRRVGFGAAALLAAATVVLGCTAALDEAQAGAEVRNGLEAIRAARDEVGPTGAVVAVSGAVPRDGVPRLEHVIEAAFAPPFAPPGGPPVFWAPNETALHRRPGLARKTGPIAVHGPESAGYPRTALLGAFSPSGRSTRPSTLPSMRPTSRPTSRPADDRAAVADLGWLRLPSAPVLEVAEGLGPEGRFLRIDASDAAVFRIEAVLFDDGPFAVRTVFLVDRAALEPDAEGRRKLPLDRTAFAGAEYEVAPDLAAVERAAAESKLRGVASPPALLRITALKADGAVLARSPFVRTPFSAP